MRISDWSSDVCSSDLRTAATCDALRAARHEPAVTAKTGLLFDPYFSATKIAWLLDAVDGAREKANAGKLAFGTRSEERRVGKEWSVRVDSGGRRTINKKIIHQRTSTNRIRIK